MTPIAIDLLQYSYGQMLDLFQHRYKKGEYHAKAFWQQLHRCGNLDIASRAEFKQNPQLAAQLMADFALQLPQASQIEQEAGSTKFRLDLGDGTFSESVVIAMKNYKSLCLSSQVGCARGCQFCATGKMGFIRNLSTQEIIAQYFYARFVLNQPIKNIVFMGMGEPFDNFDAVKAAIDILSDQRGIRIPTKFITISTVGEVSGLRKLAALMQQNIQDEDARSAGVSADICYRNLKLAVSLHAATDTLRSQLMPVNQKWPLADLKAALQAMPIKRKDHDLFIEYTLIPNVNDDAPALSAYLADLPCVVNLIAYNPVPGLHFHSPTLDQLEKFKIQLESFGIVVRMRRSKADAILGACGQLGSTKH